MLLPVDGKTLRLLRLDAERTQQELARMLGISVARLRRFERGGEPIPRHVGDRSCRVLAERMPRLPRPLAEPAARYRHALTLMLRELRRVRGMILRPAGSGVEGGS